MRNGEFVGAAPVGEDLLAVAFRDPNGAYHTVEFEPADVAALADAAEALLEGQGGEVA